MKVSEGKIGRIFIIRLEDGDQLPKCIEDFAAEKEIKVAQVTLIGGIGRGKLVVGPQNTDEVKPDPILVPIDGAHEVVGLGVIAPDAHGKIQMHMHAALGRAGKTTTGCIRPGIETWLVGEVIITEIIGTSAKRAVDQNNGFELLTTE